MARSAVRIRDSSGARRGTEGCTWARGRVLWGWGHHSEQAGSGEQNEPTVYFGRQTGAYGLRRVRRGVRL